MKRPWLTIEEAQSLARNGKVFLFEKSIVLKEPYFPEFLWDEKYRIYKLTTFIPVKEVISDAQNSNNHYPLHIV